MINYPLSVEVSEAVDAHESECYSNAYYGALYLLESGDSSFNDVTYVVGQYTTPHITTPLYHVWLTLYDGNGNGQIVDPTTVIMYDEDEANEVKYQRIKTYSSDYIINYDEALDGAPFIDIERPVTRGEFSDFSKSELKAVLRQVMDETRGKSLASQQQIKQQGISKTMKYYKSYRKTNEDNVTRNPDLAQWLTDSRDVLQQISNQGGSRSGILPLLIAMWGTCDGFNERFPDASDSGIWLDEVSEALANVVNMCSDDEVQDSELYEECGNIAGDFQECIDSVDSEMNSIAEQPVLTVRLSGKSYDGQSVKLTMGDIAKWVKEKIPFTDARQQKKLTDMMTAELEELFKEFLKLMDWWQKLAGQYGALAGQVDDFVAEYQNGIARVAPTIYNEYWDTPDGFKDWFMQNINPFIEAIRPYGTSAAAKPFNNINNALEQMAKQIADMAKIDLNALVPEGYLDDAPDNLPEWQAAASLQSSRKSIKANDEFLKWLRGTSGVIGDYYNEPNRIRINDFSEDLRLLAKRANEWADDPRIQDEYSFSDTADRISSLAKQAQNSKLDVTDFHIDAKELSDDLWDISEREDTSKSIRRIKANDPEFKNWCNNTAGLFADYRNFSSIEAQNAAKDIHMFAKRANKFADDDRIQEMYSFSDTADAMEFIAKQAEKANGRNIGDFHLNCNDMSQGLYSIADREDSYLNPEKEV